MTIRYSQSNFENQLRELVQNLKELDFERENYIRNYNIIKKNWSGNEFNKADVHFIKMKNILDTVITDLTNQKNSLEKRNQEFIKANGGRA